MFKYFHNFMFSSYNLLNCTLKNNKQLKTLLHFYNSPNVKTFEPIKSMEANNHYSFTFGYTARSKNTWKPVIASNWLTHLRYAGFNVFSCSESTDTGILILGKKQEKKRLKMTAWLQFNWSYISMFSGAAACLITL